MNNIQSSSVQALRQQRLLLEIEYNSEKEAFRRQTETTGLARKVKRGDAWHPLRFVRSYYNSLNQLSVEVVRTADTDIEHNFEFGRPVCFFRMSEATEGKSIRYFNFTGTVSYADGDRLVVTVPDNAPVAELQTTEGLGVQLFSTRRATGLCSRL